ncbi:hypothetical protein BH09BAC3_BH09BAC3_24450 [soil metagenome]
MVLAFLYLIFGGTRPSRRARTENARAKWVDPYLDVLLYSKQYTGQRRATYPIKTLSRQAGNKAG